MISMFPPKVRFSELDELRVQAFIVVEVKSAPYVHLYPACKGPHRRTPVELIPIGEPCDYRVEARKSAKWCAGLVRMCRYVQYGSRGRQTGRFEGARARG